VKKLLFLIAFIPALAFAQAPEFKLVIKEHRFTPAELRVPANKKVKLRVSNEDPTPEEFESHALNREKVIPGRSSASIFIGPLRPGRYPFEGEFNPATARGAVVAE
jgi:Cupredoxin-like domain